MLDSWGKCWTPLASVRQMLDSQFRQADGPCSVSDSAHGQTAQITTSIRIVAHVSKKNLSLSREGQMAIGMKTNRSHVITVAYLKWLMLLLQMEAERRIVCYFSVCSGGENLCRSTETFLWLEQYFCKVWLIVTSVWFYSLSDSKVTVLVRKVKLKIIVYVSSYLIEFRLCMAVPHND